jgi:hypothetical protein
MAISFACGSFFFCSLVSTSPCVCGADELTYGYAQQQCLEEGVIVGERLQDFAVVRDVDENGKRILGYGRIVFYEELQIPDRLELVVLEKRQVGLRVSDQMICRGLPYLCVSMVSGSVRQSAQVEKNHITDRNSTSSSSSVGMLRIVADELWP